jgi:NAD(P) transhydrogenase
MVVHKIYDIAIIGSGPAGEKAALEAASLKASVIVIEKGYDPGGASVITGTIPSKSLRETVQDLNAIKQSELSGIDTHYNKKITINELMHRKKAVVSNRVNFIFKKYLENSIDYLNGTASFENCNTLNVTKNDGSFISIRARKFIIAVGTRPYHPPNVDFDNKYILDSDSVLSLNYIPEEMAVFGGGVIGSEYAFIFAKLGTKVHLIDPRGKILDFIDDQISTTLVQLMEQCGIKLHLGCPFKTIQQSDDQVHITFKNDKTLSVPVLLYANGRQGLAEDLNLESCGIKLNSRSQLDVNQNYQTTIEHIYGAGDIIGFPSLVSVSNEEGRLAARHAILNEDVSRIGADIPSAIYTIPEIANIGLTEKVLQNQEIPYETGVCYFKDLARGYIIGEKVGLLKLIFQRETRELLAVHILGQNAAELVHIGQVVINMKGKIDYFVDTVFNFPTLSSAYKVAAKDGLRKLL